MKVFGFFKSRMNTGNNVDRHFRVKQEVFSPYTSSTRERRCIIPDFRSNFGFAIERTDFLVVPKIANKHMPTMMNSPIKFLHI